MEKRGIATIVLATNEFEKLARFLAKSMGFPDLRIVVIPHPLGGIPEEEAKIKGAAAVDGIVRLFEA
jgi:hypothetical protein